MQLAPRPATVASPSCRRDWQVPLVARPGLARALPHSKLAARLSPPQPAVACSPAPDWTSVSSARLNPTGDLETPLSYLERCSQREEGPARGLASDSALPERQLTK